MERDNIYVKQPITSTVGTLRPAVVAFFDRHLPVVSATVVGLFLLPGIVGLSQRWRAHPPRFEDDRSLSWYFNDFPHSLQPIITLLLIGAVLYLTLGICRSLPAEKFAPVSDHRNPLRERIIRTFERSLPVLFLITIIYTLFPDTYLLSVDMDLFVGYGRVGDMAARAGERLVRLTSYAFAAGIAYALLDIRDRLPLAGGHGS